MRIFGIVLLAIGVALLIFILFSFFREKNKLISPLPEENGVKVIFVTPTK